MALLCIKVEMSSEVLGQMTKSRTVSRTTKRIPLNPFNAHIQTTTAVKIAAVRKSSTRALIGNGKVFLTAFCLLTKSETLTVAFQYTAFSSF